MDKNWYKTSFRRNLVDMHIDAWDKEFLSLFDPEKYFQCLKKGKIKSPMIYIHSHVGWCNWSTKSGAMHPNWKGENKIKTLIDLCNKDGMDVVAYYSLIYNNWAYHNHPDWRIIDVNGHPSLGDDTHKSSYQMNGYSRYGVVCPNNQGYRDFLKTQFAELAETYEFKGIYLDMTFWPMICYCPSCQARFKKETGKELPKIVDWADPDWLLFQDSREKWLTDFANYCTKELKTKLPDITVEHQASITTDPWTFGVRSHHSKASDFTGGDLYGGYDQETFVCKLYYGYSENLPFEFQTSRCDPGLFDHTTTKSPEMLKLGAYLTYAHHGSFFVIDAIDPRGTLNEEFYETLGDVFSETMPYEQYLSGSLEADAAIYYSLASKMDFRGNKKAPAIYTDKEKYSHLECALGASKALRNAKIPFRVITDKNLGELDQSKVIILSDVAFVSREEEDALVGYAERGGSVYISGICPQNLVKRLTGLTITGMTKETVTYMRPTAEGQKFFSIYKPLYPMAIFNQQLLAELPKGSDKTILAKITLPYTVPSDPSVFAAIHSNPPGKDTEYPAIVYGSCGKGKVLWSAAPFEQSQQPVHKLVFSNLVSYLNPAKAQLKTDAPPPVEFTVFKDTDKRFVQLNCLNIQEQFPMIPLQDFSVAVRAGEVPRKVRLVPDNRDIPFTVKDGYVEFRVEGMDIFSMYQIEY